VKVELIKSVTCKGPADVKRVWGLDDEKRGWVGFVISAITARVDAKGGRWSLDGNGGGGSDIVVCRLGLMDRQLKLGGRRKGAVKIIGLPWGGGVHECV